MGGTGLGPIEREYSGADLGDERRSKRLTQIGRALQERPAAGFPRMMGGNAALEGFYRFINNESYGAEEILQPHIEATVERVAECDEVLALHDTTHVDLSGGERRGMGITTLGRTGFLAHMSLVSTLRGTPLGVVGMHTWSRTGKKWRARKNRSTILFDDPERESKRWLNSVARTEDELDGCGTKVIHVADSEGDFFEFLSAMRSSGARYVVRAAQLGRIVQGQQGLEPLREALDRLRPNQYRDVQLSERKPAPKNRDRVGSQRNMPRKARKAKLAIASTTIGFNKTKYVKGPGTPFTINVVRAWEEKPPRGSSGVEWILFTTENVKTQKQQRRVVDIYRKRWLIEEFFKALKTGCSLQKRQVESYDAMCKVLALLTPIAHRILYLKGLHRERPDSDATQAFDRADLYLLAKGQAAPVDVPETVDGAMMLLARMGGHIPNNGPPGWITLGQGYEKLLLLRMGWELARN